MVNPALILQKTNSTAVNIGHKKFTVTVDAVAIETADAAAVEAAHHIVTS